MNDEPTMYLCDCGCGAVAVSTLDLGDDDKFICLSLWQHGISGHRASWRDRLAYIWHILKIGHPYTDTVLLEPELAHALGSRLREMACAAVTPTVKRPKLKPVAPCG